MIDRAYCRRMARYNAWQNKALWGVIQHVEDAALRQDRGLPGGSMLGTLNHLLWLDRMWLSRLTPQPAPDHAAADSTDLTPTPAVWWAERFRADGALRMWSDTLASVDLHGELAFWSITAQSDVIVGRETCIVHMFNQQTDLRAQVRLVLAQDGHTLPPAALFLMP